jgi:hypothetical protein
MIEQGMALMLDHSVGWSGARIDFEFGTASDSLCAFGFGLWNRGSGFCRSVLSRFAVPRFLHTVDWP